MTCENYRKGGWLNSRMESISLLFLAALLVLSTNTLPGRYGMSYSMLKLLLLVVVTMIMMIYWSHNAIDRKAISKWVLWTILLVLIYIVVGLQTGSFFNGGALVFFAMIDVFPLLIYLLKKTGRLAILMGDYVNLMAVLGASSIVLWIIGPITGIIHPNCSIMSTWGSVDLPKRIDGYYYLLYTAQNVRVLSRIMPRNTGIFCEAPMYSLALSIALMMEMCLRSKPRISIVFILAACIITTVSYTGYISLILLAVYAMHTLQLRTTHGRMLRALFVCAMIPLSAFFLYYLMADKLGTASGGTRLDDFVAGYKAWMHNPLFGNGFSDSDTAKTYMSGFRAHNTGFSNTLMDVLSKGGLCFLLLYLLAFVMLFISSDTRFSSVLLLFLWVFTISTYMPVMAFMLSLSILHFDEESCPKVPETKNTIDAVEEPITKKMVSTGGTLR